MKRTIFRDLLVAGLVLMLAGVGGYGYGRIAKSQQQVPILESASVVNLLPETAYQTVVFSNSTCLACAKALEWLEKNKIQHTVVVIDQSSSARELAQTLDIKTVPTFFIKDVRINGFHEATLRASLISSTRNFHWPTRPR